MVLEILILMALYLAYVVTFNFVYARNPDSEDVTICVSKPTECPSGSYSPSGDFSKCVKCSKCDENMRIVSECSQTSNTVCEPYLDIYADAYDALFMISIGILFLIFITATGYVIIQTSNKPHQNKELFM